MFSQVSKIAVLESKLSMYEELSREMLSKLESAVEKISEGNQRIANILTKHDERIEQSIKTDGLLISRIDEVKNDNREEHQKVIQRIENLESKLEEIIKFRWIIVGIVAVISVALSQSSIVIDLLTPDQNSAIIQRQK